MRDEIDETAAIVRQTTKEIRQEYGRKPLLLGLLTRDPFVLNAGYSIGGLVLLASGLWTFVLALAYFWRNDYQANFREFEGESLDVDTVTQGLEPDSPFPAFQPQDAPTASSPKESGLTPREPFSPTQSVAIPKAPTAYETLVANRFLSRAGFGAQRTGKSYLFAVATQELASGGVQIFHINLASYGDEDVRYWGHAIRSVRCDLPSLDEYQAQHFVDEAIDTVHQFFATRNAVLVFDEITLTGAISNQHSEIVAPLLKLVADKISCLASTGVKRSQAVWTASPDFVAGNCTQDCKAIKSLSLCYVAIPPGKSVDWNGNPVKFHQETFENVRRNYPSLTYPKGKWKGDRICFVDGQWRELGELPSLQASIPVESTVAVHSEDLIIRKLERAYENSESLPPDRFEQLANELNRTEQENLKTFVLWLGKRQGTEITFDQVKGSWARNAGVERSKEALMPFIHFAVYKGLLHDSGNNKWVVAG